MLERPRVGREEVFGLSAYRVGGGEHVAQGEQVGGVGADVPIEVILAGQDALVFGDGVFVRGGVIHRLQQHRESQRLRERFPDVQQEEETELAPWCEQDSARG